LNISVNTLAQEKIFQGLHERVTLMSNLFTLGEFRVDRVEEMSGPFFPPSFLPGLPEDALAREAHWLIQKQLAQTAAPAGGLVKAR